MPSLFQQIKAGQLWDFHGGIHPPARKQYTSQKPIGRMSLPERLYVPLRQHIGVAGALLVHKGQRVLKGQPLTASDSAMAVPVHAPTSGYILAIEPHIAPHPSALPEPCVVIEPDGLEEWRPRHGLNLLESDRIMLLQRIQGAGIAGMGGAGFPTHLKSGVTAGIDYLIINAVECEPYISADDVLMQEYATTIVKGIDILCQLMNPAAVLIGIEDDKAEAIAAMQAACSQRDNYLVRVVPAKYPSGGEKQLIQLLTSKEVPAGRRPLDIGIVMQNVGTAFAIAQAVLEDIPLISRIVTVTGDTLSQPQNMHALIGTPVGALLDACGFAPEPQQRVIMGGPMMGFTLPSLSVPVVKTSNCILAPTQQELPAANNEMDCIRCGACAEVCPATLLPQQLLWYSKAKDHDKLKEYNLSDCIECGACAYVCPSEIPLVHYYRVAKADIREQTRDELKAEQAKARFEARNERLEKEKQERAARNQALAAQRQQLMNEQQKQKEVLAAAERVASQHAEQQPLSKEDIIAERERKKAQARAYQAAKAGAETQAQSPVQEPAEATLVTESTQAVQAQGTETTGTHADPRAAAVAAAIARAKAKKAAHDEPGKTADTRDNNIDNLSPSAAPEAIAAGSAATADPRAAAVAAAIARAKAKKAAQAEPATPHNVAAEAIAGQTITQTAPATTQEAVNTAEDPKAAAVAAAIARAKAKKAAQVGVASTKAVADEVVTETSTRVADETAKEVANDATNKDVTEAAHKSVGHAESAGGSAEPSAEALTKEQAKKAALAAAIAKARAKQQQQPDVTASAGTETAAPDRVINTTAETTLDTNQDTIADAAVDTAAAQKKAAIAAAIARAKAKQQAASQAPDSEDEA